MIEIPKFDTKKELFNFLVTNKDKLIAQKKSITKEADGFGFVNIPSIQKYGVSKQDGAVEINIDSLMVKAVINTTNIMDSHYDVHLPGLWKKSLQENRMIMHVQEHQMSKFNHIISDGEDLKAFTEKFSWSSIGFPELKGSTEALVFESVVKRARNPFMFDQYRNKYVRNHSVGMRYVKIILCVNDEDHGAEFEAWEKYIPEVSNKETAEEKGFFWAIKEAKVVEGSAVPLGSNQATPTISVEADKSITLTENKEEAEKSLHREQLDFYKHLN